MSTLSPERRSDAHEKPVAHRQAVYQRFRHFRVMPERIEKVRALFIAHEAAGAGEPDLGDIRRALDVDKTQAFRVLNEFRRSGGLLDHGASL